MAVSHGTVRIVLREHTLAAQLEASGHQLADPVPSNVITASLGVTRLPSDVIYGDPLDDALTVVIGTSNILRHLSDARLIDIAGLIPSLAAQEILRAGWSAGQSIDPNMHTGAVLLDPFLHSY